MAFAGLIFIGLLFGILLSGIVVGFIVVRSGGPIKESLFGNGDGKLKLGAKPSNTELAVETDTRVRALQEDLRISQKLLDQGRIEREQNSKAAKVAAEEIAGVRQQCADRDGRILALECELRDGRQRYEDLLGLLSDRTEELAKASAQLKDARTELEVSESGSTVTISQISRLQQERDELAALVDQLRPRRPASRPFA